MWLMIRLKRCLDGRHDYDEYNCVNNPITLCVYVCVCVCVCVCLTSSVCQANKTFV